MEMKPEKLFNFLLDRKKNENYEIIFIIIKRKEREKAKTSILIVLKMSSEDS